MHGAARDGARTRHFSLGKVTVRFGIQARSKTSQDVYPPSSSSATTSSSPVSLRQSIGVDGGHLKYDGSARSSYGPPRSAALHPPAHLAPRQLDNGPCKHPTVRVRRTGHAHPTDDTLVHTLRSTCPGLPPSSDRPFIVPTNCDRIWLERPPGTRDPDRCRFRDCLSAGAASGTRPTAGERRYETR